MTGVNGYEVAVGALLHDIGKFMQRAFPQDQGLSDESCDMEQLICPMSPAGYATHRHVLYTYEYVTRGLDWLPKGLNRETVAALASFHHRPLTTEQRWITEADRLSAGIDRRDDESMEKQAARRFREIRLCSVAAGVGLDAADSLPVCRLQPLTPEAIFPHPPRRSRIRPRPTGLCGISLSPHGGATAAQILFGTSHGPSVCWSATPGVSPRQSTRSPTCRCMII